MRRGFGSDNHSGVHPLFLAAIAEANVGHAPSYGTDNETKKSEAIIKDHFGPAAETYFVFNGTAANVLSLAALVQSHHAVLVASQAHLINDECGAPEDIVGCKMISIPTTDGKLTPELITPQLIRRGDQHASQVRMISITQSTESGTIYELDEIRALGELAKKENLYLHVDGARLVNAAAALGCTLKEMTTDCGVDVLSLGGTKNGLLFGEAVVFLKPGLCKEFRFIRKQKMQLPSKTRFISAQFNVFLGTDLWRKNALHANEMAQYLYSRLLQSKHAKLTQIPRANAVFALIPKRFVSKLRETAFFYVWNEATFECRFMTTWDTQREEIDAFVQHLEQLGDAAT